MTFFSTILAAFIGASFSPVLLALFRQRRKKIKFLEEIFIKSKYVYEYANSYQNYKTELLKLTPDVHEKYCGLKAENKYDKLIDRLRCILEFYFPYNKEHIKK